MFGAVWGLLCAHTPAPGAGQGYAPGTLTRSFLRSALLAAAASSAACEPDPIIEVEVLPYEGEAYPDRVPDVAYPSGPYALVTDSLSDTISVLDLEAGTKIDARPVGRIPVDIDGPHHLAVHPGSGFAYVALSYPASMAVGPHAQHGSSAQSGYVQKLRLADLSIVGQVRVDPSPGDIVISEDGTMLVSSHFDLLRATQNPTNIEVARSTIAIIDPDTLALSDSPAARLVKVCVAPHGMAMTQPSGSTVYVACYGEDKIAVVDAGDSDVSVELFDVGPGVSGFGSPIYGPYALLLLPGDTTLVVSNTASKEVRFFDIRTKEVDPARTIVTLGAPYFTALSADGSHLLIPTQQPDALVIVDLEGDDETVTHTFVDDECVLPHAVQVFEDGYVVVCEGDKKKPGKVVRLDADLEIVAEMEVGVYPDAIVRLDGGPR